MRFLLFEPLALFWKHPEDQHVAARYAVNDAMFFHEADLAVECHYLAVRARTHRRHPLQLALIEGVIEEGANQRMRILTWFGDGDVRESVGTFVHMVDHNPGHQFAIALGAHRVVIAVARQRVALRNPSPHPLTLIKYQPIHAGSIKG